MDPEKARIKASLEKTLTSIYCPLVGCWPVHGCHYEYYYDTGSGSHVLEVWPVAISQADGQEDSDRRRIEDGLAYELAEFEFSRTARQIPLDHLHFSQLRSVFEIGWRENGLKLELRVHLEPVEKGGIGLME